MDGILAEHMAAHIIAMNVMAPVVALIASHVSPRVHQSSRPASIGLATIVQIALLWAWHTPAAVNFAAASSAAMTMMHLSLFAAALWFWMCVIKEAADARWRSLGALLITGKLFCLLGVLLVFAPRPIYSAAFHIHAGNGHAVAVDQMMSDQQVAGLLMLIACPATYLLAGVIIVARWLSDIERRPTWLGPEAGV